MSDHLTLTQKDLEQDGFSKKPFFHVIVAEVPESHKSSGAPSPYAPPPSCAASFHDTALFPSSCRRPPSSGLQCHTKIGYALYYFGYNSRKGRTVHMDDLYVMPESRGKGIGKALMSKVAQLGMAAGCKQLDFIVKDTNTSAIDFYARTGCFDVTERHGYHLMRCEGEAMQSLAQP
ncbi:diamine acetyltransferase 2-like isoform X1 [Salarias fasciatus]|uniref:diamine acetyltransferase 2-like isoform X1 n=1 Tax=Salarias fasciatus TaxID=181472 RepID=UPI001176FBA1|nr:diamine acetyltransferase 2-like isoform X1 [Salarias fasciatus]